MFSLYCMPFSFCPPSHLIPAQIGSVIIALNGMSLPNSFSLRSNTLSRPTRTNTFRNIQIRTHVHRTRISRLHRCTHNHRTKHHHLFRSKVRPHSSPTPSLTASPHKVWQEKHDLVHHCLQYHWWHQRQRHDRSWGRYRHLRHGL